MSADFANWTPRPRPGLVSLQGVSVRLEPLDWSRHGESLFAAVGGTVNQEIWRYMPFGPFPEPEGLRATLEHGHAVDGREILVILDRQTARVLGTASFMRIREAHGSAEIGCVAFGSDLKRTTAATEAFSLMARHLFDDLGYRRFEWKCHNDNDASKRAATRFGFNFEGVFRQDMVMKGENRDTAWFSIIDREWPAIRAAFDSWLAPANFGAEGQQIRRLEEIRGGTR